jgi:hypothetical protein
VIEHGTNVRTWRDWLAVLGAYVVVPNLPFLVAAQFIYLERATINLDYIALGLLSPLFPKALNLALFAIVFLLDILFSTSGIYHFPVADAVRALRSVGHVSPAISIPIFLFTILTVYVMARLATKWRRVGVNPAWHELTAVLILLVAMDLLNNRLGNQRFEIARSSVGTTVLAAGRDFRPLDLEPKKFWRIESASKGLDKDIEEGKLAGENVVLVLVESLGEARDPKVAAWIEAPLRSEQVQGRYMVSTGTVGFEGSTVFGELRELCGLRGVGMRVTELQRSQMGECLPSKLDAKGYATVSVHGVTSAMFRRNIWYPTVGFQRMIFPENWPRKNPGYCSTQFHAICDIDAVEVVHDELLASTQPKFVYWLTAESHLQLDAAAMRPPAGGCSGMAPDVCWMVTTQRNALAAIARIALDPTLKPTRFVIVGDHSPPYMLRSRRDLFAQKRVPWMELTPKP